MADDPTQIKPESYQSQVPLVQIPRDDVQPGGFQLPVSAGYMGKSGSIATIGNELLRGFIRGHEVKAQKQVAIATKSIDVAAQSESSAYQNYQDALRTGQAQANNHADPHYQAYLKAQQDHSDTMAKYSIPDKPPKGQKKKEEKQADGELIKPKSRMDKFKDFMAANPHIVPQLVIASRQPLPPTMSADTQQTKNTLDAQAQRLALGKQELAAGDVQAKQVAQQVQDQQVLRSVDEAGGIDAVADGKGKNATPEMVQAARRTVASRLDSTSKDAQLRDQLATIAANGGRWTSPDQRAMAVHFGYAAAPKEETIEKGGYRYLVTLDPETNQPVKGSQPLKLGPTTLSNQLASVNYERNLDRKDIANAVKADPAKYGVTMTGNEEQDNAAVKMASLRIFSEKESGLARIGAQTGQSLPDLQRDNNVLQGTFKQIDQAVGAKDGAARTYDWPGGQKIDLTKPQIHQILDQFVDTPQQGQGGIYSFRQQPVFDSSKKSPQAVERDRKWAYSYIKDRMLATPPRGKNPPMTSAEADAILQRTSLGQPISGGNEPEGRGGMQPPPGGRTYWDHLTTPWKDWGQASGGIQPPPNAMKSYQVEGVDGYVQLTDAEAAKAKAAGHQLTELPAELLAQ